MSDDRLLDILHEDRSTYRGAINPPIYRTSTFDQHTYEALQDPNFKPPRFIYSRAANPTVRVFEELVARLEGGDDAIAFGSGMGGITAVILSLLSHGDHVLCVQNAYHPAQDFLTALTDRMQLTVEYFEPGANLEPLMRSNTKLIYLESPTTGHFQVLDLPAISRVARAHGAVTVIDNTWATPIYQKPLELGIDVTLHSATKYLCGHSDVMAGVVVANDKLMQTIRPMSIALGATLSPEDAFLCIRGIRTLAIRMPHHMESGLTVARWLHDHPLVEKVNHPGLPDSPDYELARSQMSGYSGLFSFALKAAPESAVAAFINALTLYGIAPSWGGFESLLLPFAFKVGEPVLFRISIGLEPTEALIADLDHALQHYAEAIPAAQA